MIDNITLKYYEAKEIKHLTPDFFRSKYDVGIVGINDYTFNLYNSENKSSSFLKVVCSHIDSAGNYVSFRIQGSLRKWWYGDKSVKDFNKKDFNTAINFLLEFLEVSESQRKFFLISRIEIGLNIFVKVPCSEILSRIVGYKKGKHYSRNTYGDTGIVYETKTNRNHVKMYDKVEEIAKDFKKKFLKSFEEDQFLKDYADNNILRIEFSIATKSKICDKLGFDNLQDSIDNFDNLFCYYWEQIKGIQFSNAYDSIPIMDFTDKSDKEFTDYLKIVGIYTLKLERVERMVKQLKNRSMRAKIKKLHESPMITFCSYDQKAFMINIKNQMLLPMYHSGCLYLVKVLFL